ncbi:hypothetical protein [Caldovatus aquaticus]|uniref:Uncharacterized protein n=1 Tax=Caldovatus aquaticus TaxID=2865671 RepID=A0ABS7EXK4_9PROT|nr:hypothetical protein [Caldovatus aquaticus]MBW8268092.1 hypothetical protein [Caldovatus aquaticus]
MLARDLARCALCTFSVGMLWQALGTALAELAPAARDGGAGLAAAQGFLRVIAESGRSASDGGEALLGIAAACCWALARRARSLDRGR